MSTIVYEGQANETQKVEKMDSIVKRLALMLLAFTALAINALATAPVITGTTVSADNSTVSVTFDQPVYTDTIAVVSTFAGSGPGSTDGVGIAASFEGPIGVAVDSAGNVYVADKGNRLIRKITSGGVVSTLAGGGDQIGAVAINGQGSVASFKYPEDVAVDSAGNVYVGDGNNQLIRKITPGGLVSTFAGSSGTTGSTDGMGTAALFRNPEGLAVDSSDNIYVADTNNHLIRKITPGGVVTTLAGGGGTGATDGVGTAAYFNKPYGVAVDSNDNIYVADTWNNRIRKITPGGVVTTFAGSGAVSSTNGVGIAASFNRPYRVAVDSNDNIYVADRDSHMIRKITPEGLVSTLAGDGGTGSADGVGTVATVNNPHGVAVDSNDNIYVADAGNNRIRKITLGAPLTTTDFTLSVSGGVANLTGSTPTAISAIGNVYTLTLPTLTDTPNGLEVITVNPAGATAIYNGAAEAASDSQSNNNVNLGANWFADLSLDATDYTWFTVDDSSATLTVRLFVQPLGGIDTSSWNFSAISTVDALANQLGSTGLNLMEGTDYQLLVVGQDDQGTTDNASDDVTETISTQLSDLLLEANQALISYLDVTDLSTELTIISGTTFSPDDIDDALLGVSSPTDFEGFVAILFSLPPGTPPSDLQLSQVRVAISATSDLSNPYHLPFTVHSDLLATALSDPFDTATVEAALANSGTKSLFITTLSNTQTVTEADLDTAIAVATRVDFSLAAQLLNTDYIDQALLKMALDSQTDGLGNTNFHQAASDLGLSQSLLLEKIAISQAKSVVKISLVRGLNIISLPNRPDTALTAYSLAQQISTIDADVSVNFVIRMDPISQQFKAFVPSVDASDSAYNFSIDGGSGYIINLADADPVAAREVSFSGGIWVDLPGAPTAISTPTWAFVIDSPDPVQLGPHVKPRASG